MRKHCASLSHLLCLGGTVLGGNGAKLPLVAPAEGRWSCASLQVQSGLFLLPSLHLTSKLPTVGHCRQKATKALLVQFTGTETAQAAPVLTAHGKQPENLQAEPQPRAADLVTI